MNVVLIKINQILMEKFLKLQDVCRTQVGSSLISLNNTEFNSNTLVTSYLMCVWAAGVVGQRAGEERSHWSRWGSHDAHETDRWCVHTQMQIMLQCIPTSCV